MITSFLVMVSGSILLIGIVIVILNIIGMIGEFLQNMNTEKAWTVGVLGSIVFCALLIAWFKK